MAKSKEARTCKLVFMKDGKPQECGGVIKKRDVLEPFNLHMPMGSRPETVLTYDYCEKCRVIYNCKER